MMQELLIIALFSIGFNLFMFIPAYLLKTDKLTDISYSLTFIAIVGYTLFQGEFNIPRIVLSGMILLWALRLGGYLLIRIQRMGRDKRFDEMRGQFWSFLGFWTLQGISVFVIMIPAVFFLMNDAAELSNISFIGIFIWFAGLLIETIADQQKFAFKSKPSNRDKWPMIGLWKYSRYPNYLGEILVWAGLFIVCLHSLSEIQILIGIVSPIYIALLLIFVSGIPLLEKKYEERWSHLDAYKAYKKRTGKLIPKNTGIFIIAIIIPQLAGALGAFFTMQSVDGWYLTLVKPGWNPPAWVFGPVWTLLYTMMGIASFLIWKKRGTIRVSKALAFYGVQLIFNILWSMLFFGSKNIGLALIEIIVLWVLIFITLKEFYKINKNAALLLIPYLLWVTFASFLNFNLWLLN